MSAVIRTILSAERGGILPTVSISSSVQACISAFLSSSFIPLILRWVRLPLLYPFEDSVGVRVIGYLFICLDIV
jgi:hypothetical protein